MGLERVHKGELLIRYCAPNVIRVIKSRRMMGSRQLARTMGKP